MGRTFRAFKRLAVCGLAAASCTTNYYDSYRAAHPEWIPELPSKGITLEQTVAAIHAPARSDYIPTILRLEILRDSASGLTPIALEDLQQSRFSSTTSESYAVIAFVTCRFLGGGFSIYGESISWYLLPKNSLIAWEHNQHEDQCTLHQQYLPAQRENIAFEEKVADRIRASYPEVREFRQDLYEKGLALVHAGRVDDAREMLERADHYIDRKDEKGVDTFNTERSNIAKESDRLTARDRLVEAIRLADATTAPDVAPGSSAGEDRRE